MTFPDEKLIDELLERAEITAKQIRAQSINGWGNTVDDLSALIRDLRTRTGMDIADVIAKLSAGTHVVVPVEPTEAMVEAWSKAKPQNDAHISDDDANRAWATADWQAMIRAVQEKVE